MTRMICENDEIVAIYSFSYIGKEQPKRRLPVWVGLIAWVLGFGALYGLMVLLLAL